MSFEVEPHLGRTDDEASFRCEVAPERDAVRVRARLHLALKWHAAARQDGFEIGFAPGPPVVQRLFELTGMTE